MGFNVVDRRKTGDKVMKVLEIGVFNIKVVHDQTEGDGAGGVAKEARDRGLDKAERQEKFDKLQVR
jgi:hypothetical protein